MAKIVINEISQNYTYAIGNNNYATVAMPITACWGESYQDPQSVGKETVEEVLENVRWQHFPATREGLEAFVSTYRGPSSNYRLTKDYSYQMAMTLISMGYDVLVCRLCPGTNAQGQITIGSKKLTIKAKYPGSFGNNLRVVVNKLKNYSKAGTFYWNAITYIVDDSGMQSAVENITFVMEPENSTDSLPCIDEVESNFLTLVPDAGIKDADTYTDTAITLSGGADKAADKTATEMITSAKAQAVARYKAAGLTTSGDDVEYCNIFTEELGEFDDVTKAASILHREWLFTAAFNVYTILEDKLAYNPQRIISPGWDDQDVSFLTGSVPESYKWDKLSPLHIQLMDVAYKSRCGVSYIDVPKSMPRSKVWDDSTETPGYAQQLARYSQEVLESKASEYEFGTNIPLYSSHSAFFAPWGQFIYTGTSKMQDASPSFLALAIERAMILNQSIQYEWALPTTRSHNLNIGKLAYNVPKKLLDKWQTIEGVGVNVITEIPEVGTGLWGNSTLFEVPPATYQALANLSTRKLVNAIENLAFKCGVNITFRYNNQQAYSAFSAGVSPLLDTMRNVGAIEDYRIVMNADIRGLDHVNANTVIGKIFIVVPGVINDIYVDLIALPSGTDLNSYVEG